MLDDNAEQTNARQTDYLIQRTHIVVVVVVISIAYGRVGYLHLIGKVNDVVVVAFFFFTHSLSLSLCLSVSPSLCLFRSYLNAFD